MAASRPTAPTPYPLSRAQTGTSTTDHAWSSRLVIAIITPMPISTGSRRMNDQPSRSSPAYVVATAAASASARTAGVAGARPRVESASTTPPIAKEAASTTSALAPPTSATSPPATAAPASEAVRSTAPASPVTRSVGRCACSTSSGSIACPAASPGPRAAPARATSTSSRGKVSRPSTCSSGMAPTTTALTALQVSAIRRAPMRSM